MAMDEWMFYRAINTPGLIILRLYSWDTGAITFGYNQNENMVVDGNRISGTPLIRRVTGGRALYHEPSELTYAIAVNNAGLDNETLNSSLSKSSRAFSLALLEFLNALDIKAHYMRQSAVGFSSAASFRSQPCFESYARNEILGDQGKIIASAQRRIGTAFLQHGSIKINGVAAHAALYAKSNNSLDNSQIGRLNEIEFARYSDLFCDLIGRYLGVSFGLTEIGEVESEELAKFEQLVREKSIFRRDSIEQMQPQRSLSIDRHN